MRKPTISRRKFIESSAKATIAASFTFGGFPTIVPSSVFGKNAPGEKINIGQIGFGRIAFTHDLPETMKYDIARVIAVADPDSKRAALGKKHIDDFYSKKTGKANYMNARIYDDYHNMLQNPDIDAVIISTPDHWHAQPAIEAALAGRKAAERCGTEKEGDPSGRNTAKVHAPVQDSCRACKKWQDRKTRDSKNRTAGRSFRA
jgi:hypothetical protein